MHEASQMKIKAGLVGFYAIWTGNRLDLLYSSRHRQNRLCQQTDGISGSRWVSGQVRLLRLRLTVKNIKQSDGQTQQITEAIETEVDKMTGKFHNLKHTQSHIICLRRADSNISTGWPSNCVI